MTNRKLYDYYSFLNSRLFHLHLYFELILLETRNLKRCFVAMVDSKFSSVQKGENYFAFNAT